MTHSAEGPSTGSRGGRSRVIPLRPSDPRSVGGYVLRGLLGQGGMGHVYLGEEPGGGRLVAVKVIRQDLAEEPTFTRRFYREAELARRVAQFCTAEVIDVGEEDGRPYLVTEYVAGPTLWDAVQLGGPMPRGQLERVAISVATALRAIHDAGMVHRDLKPSNVMLSAGGPVVIDFGIAHALDGTVHLTSASFGTPAFMAPEQARDDHVTQAADIFAWGGIVVYTATGLPPFGVGRVDELIYRVVHERPKLDGVPEPLRAVVRAAMHPSADQRPTARQIYDRLLASVASPAGRTPATPHPPPPSLSLDPALMPTATPELGVPLSTDRRVRPGQTRRTTMLRQVRRSRWLPPVALAAVLAVAVPLLIVLSGGGESPATPRSRPAIATSLAGEARRIADDSPELARRLAVAAHAISPSRETRFALADTAASPLATLAPDLGVPGGEGTWINKMAFGVNGTLLVTASSTGLVHLWDVAPAALADSGAKTPIAALGLSNGSDVYDVAFGGGRLAAAGADGALALWDVGGVGSATGITATPRYALDVGGSAIRDLAFNGDGSLLATANDDGTASMWNAGTGQLVATVPSGGGAVRDVGFSPGGLLVTSGESGRIGIWTAAGGHVATLDSRAGAVNDLAFNRDGSRLATAGANGTSRVWDIASRPVPAVPLTVLTGHSDDVVELAFGPDPLDGEGEVLATVSTDRTGRLWNADGSVRAVLKGHTEGVVDLAFGPDGTLATASADGTARLWDVGTGAALATVGDASGDLHDLNPDPGGTMLATAGAPGTARLWDLDAARLFATACAAPAAQTTAAQITAAEWEHYVAELPYDPPCD